MSHDYTSLETQTVYMYILYLYGLIPMKCYWARKKPEFREIPIYYIYSTIYGYLPKNKF